MDDRTTEDPDRLDTPLPCDVDFGTLTFRQGTPLGVLVSAARRWWTFYSTEYAKTHSLKPDTAGKRIDDMNTFSVNLTQTDPGSFDWVIVLNTLKDCKMRLQANGVRHTWLDAPIAIAEDHMRSYSKKAIDNLQVRLDEHRRITTALVSGASVDRNEVLDEAAEKVRATAREISKGFIRSAGHNDTGEIIAQAIEAMREEPC